MSAYAVLGTRQKKIIHEISLHKQTIAISDWW